MSTSNCTSADRLHDILLLLIYPPSNTSTPNRVTASNQIANFFGCASSDNKAISHYYSKIHELACNLKKISSSVGGRTASGFEANMDDIIHALHSIGIYSPIGLDEYNELLNNEIALAGLKKLADYIADNNLEKDIDDNELTQIKEQLQNLVTTVANSAIDANLKKRLLTNLNSLNSSIQDHIFFGTSAINNNLEKITGQLILDAQWVEHTEENTSILRQVFDKMRDFNTVFSFATTLRYNLPVITYGVVQLFNGR